jgi:hypothetical protein
MGGEYGPATTDDGEVRYSSASSLTTADPNSYGGCLRRWWFKYRGHETEPTTAAMLRGTNVLHKPIENYYETGAQVFGPLVMSGKRYLYERGPDLLFEHEIARPPGAPKLLANGKPTPIVLADAPLKAIGCNIPIVGKLDLTHARGVYIDERGELKPEPHPGVTIESNDWKSTGGKEYAKSAEELRRTVQMITYAAFDAAIAPRAEFFRLSHTYFLTKGAPEAWKSTILIDRDEVGRGWEYVSGVARSVRDAARETDPERVEGNPKACDSYRKGCPHRAKCSIGSHNSLNPGLKELFGANGAAALLTPNQGDFVSIKNLFAPTPAAQPAISATPSEVAAVLTIPVDIVAQLKAEEARAKQPTISPALAQAFETFTAAQVHGLGRPKFEGFAAQAFALWGGQAMAPDATFPGTGKLAGLDTIADEAQAVKIASDLKAYLDTQPKPEPAPQPAPVVVQHNTTPIAILPAETPASSTQLAAVPVAGFGAQPAPQAAAPLIPMVSVTPAVQQAIVAAGAVSIGSTASSPVAPTPAKVKAPKGAKKAPPTAAEDKPETEPTTSTNAEEPFELYIDCIPSKPFESLDTHIAFWANGLANFYKLNPADIRCAPKDVATCAFGAWKGALGALAQECARTGKLPRARYVVHTSGSEFNQVVAEALISAHHKQPDGNDDTDRPVLDNYTRGIK